MALAQSECLVTINLAFIEHLLCVGTLLIALRAHSHFILKMLQDGLHWFPRLQMRTSEAQRGSPALGHRASER